MRFKQVNPMPLKHKYRLYSPTAMTNAYLSVKDDNRSVMGAARQFDVPVTTLRDRVLGNVDPETVKSGRNHLLDNLQESNVVKHLKVMADYGYGYTRQETVDLATDYAVQIGIRDRQHPFTLKWFREFVRRWPEIRVLNPRSLEIARAKCASVPVVDKYFEELHQVIKENGFDKEPHLIYNVDEKGFTQNHTPPSIVCSSQNPPQSVTAGRSCTTTVIGCGSATGAAIPPLFIFAGKRMTPNLMEGATPGAQGAVSDSGWSNSQLFREYLQEHFLKHVPLQEGKKVLLLLDGHRSHASVGLAEWARDRNVILFILPAHTSHILQPLDVGCYGPMQSMYNTECHKFTRESHCVITRYNVCQLVCRVYGKAMSTDNLISAFKKTGIHPCDRGVIPPETLKPAEVFRECFDEVEAHDGEEEGQTTKTDSAGTEFFKDKEQVIRDVKRKGGKKERNTMSKIVAGHCITDDIVIDRMTQHAEQQKKSSSKRKTPRGESQEPSGSGSKTKRQRRQNKENKTELGEESEDTDLEIEIQEKELCCVCKEFTPKEIRNSNILIFANWAQCDGIRNGMPCNHWTHLKYCCSTRVIRRNDKFFCSHCI